MLRIFIKIIGFTILLNSCNAQKTNPKYIGDRIFDLDQITFKENLDTLMQNVKYIKRPLEKNYYKDYLKIKVPRDTLAIAYKIIDEKYNESSLFYFLDESLKKNRIVKFLANENHKLVCFYFTDWSKEPYDNILEKINKKYKEYRVNLKENEDLKSIGAEIYQWETEEKIIVMYRTIKKAGGEYICYITVVDKEGDFKNIVNNIIVSAAKVCLDNSCKEE